MFTRIPFFDSFGRFQGLFGWYSDFPFPKQGLNEGRNIPAGYGDVLDAGTDDVAFGHRNDMSHAVSRIDDDPSKRSFSHLNSINQVVSVNIQS